jgi:hypothetical protein
MPRPTAVLPVKLTALMPGCSTRARPAAAPPWTMLNTPGGSPASRHSSPNIQAVSGVTSLGLPTTVLPAASAGAIFQVNRYSGRFHGLMQATPSGWRSVKFSVPASPAWLSQVRDPSQQRGAGARWLRGPGRGGARRCGDGGIDIGRARIGHVGIGTPGRRFDDRQVARGLRGAEIPVDEIGQSQPAVAHGQ